MDVSENNGFSPQIIHFNRIFHYFHPSFWGKIPYFWKHPYVRFGEEFLASDSEALEGRVRVLEGNAVQQPQRAVQRAVLQAAFVCWCRGDGWNGRSVFARFLPRKYTFFLKK